MDFFQTGQMFRLLVIFRGQNVVDKLTLVSTPPSVITALAFSTCNNVSNESPTVGNELNNWIFARADSLVS